MTLRHEDIIIFGGVVAFLVIVFLLLNGDNNSARSLKRLERMRKQKASPQKSAGNDAVSLRRKTNEPTSRLLNALMAPLPNIQSISDRLERAGSALTAKQYILRCLLSLVIITVLFKVMGKSLAMGFFIGIILSVWFPLKVLGFKINKKKKAFLRLFPDAIDLIVRGLRSGLPVAESIKLVAVEVQAPVGPTFDHISNTMKLGVPMEKALQDVAKKLQYTEFNFFVTSIILQRETGGNLSEILNNLGEVLRKRFLMQMKIKAMSSEARASAMIVAALPFFVVAAVSVMSPDYIKPIFNDYRGNIAGIVAACMMSFGIWTMVRMARFDF